MLINFSVGNFLSFKEIQTLNLTADSFKELEDNLHTPYFYDRSERLLKSIAIYGHNSHGKTNFIKAFQFFHDLIFYSFLEGQTGTSVHLEFFRLNTEMRSQPSYFEVTFLVKEIRYRYRLILTSTAVVREELTYAQAKIRENFLFERTGQEIKISKLWNKENNNSIDAVKAFAKPHILFLSVLFSQEKRTHLAEVREWLFANIIVPDNYLLELEKARQIYTDERYRSLILKFIHAADLGFTTIFDKLLGKSKYDKKFLNDAYSREITHFELYTNHSIYDKDHKEVEKTEFELLKQESAGTIKYFVIVCLLSSAIKNSQLIWIDELDARFHSLLLDMLLTSFHNPDINPINAQLIFTTHNTVLLDQKLRRDQMVLVEKNEWGESCLRRAHTVETPIRIGKSMEKEYRKGKLGGVSKRLKDNLGPTLFD